METDCYPGVYKGIVADNSDPTNMFKIRAKVPQVLADAVSTWALPCVPSLPAAPPNVGDPVWITFEAGDVEHPVWLGKWFTPQQTYAPPPPVAPTEQLAGSTSWSWSASGSLTIDDPLAVFGVAVPLVGPVPPPGTQCKMQTWGEYGVFTNGSGDRTASFPKPFPNGVLFVNPQIIWAAGAFNNWKILTHTTATGGFTLSQMTYTLWDTNASAPVLSSGHAYQAMAVGW